MNAAARIAAQIVDQRAAVFAALEMPLDGALFGAVETPVDEVDDGFVEVCAVHIASVVSPRPSAFAFLQPCARYDRIRIRALCTCDFDVPSEMPSIAPTS